MPRLQPFTFVVAAGLLVSAATLVGEALDAAGLGLLALMIIGTADLRRLSGEAIDAQETGALVLLCTGLLLGALGILVLGQATPVVGGLVAAALALASSLLGLVAYRRDDAAARGARTGRPSWRAIRLLPWAIVPGLPLALGGVIGVVTLGGTALDPIQLMRATAANDALGWLSLPLLIVPGALTREGRPRRARSTVALALGGAIAGAGLAWGSGRAPWPIIGYAVAVSLALVAGIAPRRPVIRSRPPTIVDALVVGAIGGAVFLVVFAVVSFSLILVGP